MAKGSSARAATVAVVVVVGIGGAIYFGVFDRLKQWLLDWQQANPPGTTVPPVIPPIVIPPIPPTIPPPGGGGTPVPPPGGTLPTIPPPAPPTATGQPPDLTVSQPLQNSRHLRRSTVLVQGTAFPNVISKSPIARVNIRLINKNSGSQLMMVDVNTLSDTSFKTSTPALIQGNYEVTCKAVDNAGKTSSRSITFQVVLSLAASTVPYVPPGGIAPPRLAALAISVMMSLNTRLKDVITGIRAYTDQSILSYYASGAYRTGGGTGFNDGQLQAIEQESNDRLKALGLTVKWP